MKTQKQTSRCWSLNNANGTIRTTASTIVVAGFLVASSAAIAQTIAYPGLNRPTNGTIIDPGIVKLEPNTI